MSVRPAEGAEACRSMDLPEDMAIEAATAPNAWLIEVEDDTMRGFFKRDADIEAIRKDVTTLKVDTAVLRWMNGVLLTMVTAILFKLFLR